MKKVIDADFTLDELMAEITDQEPEPDDLEYKTMEQWARFFGVGRTRMKEDMRRLVRAGRMEHKAFRAIAINGHPYWQPRYRLVPDED